MAAKSINKCAVVSYGRQIDNSYSYFIRREGTDNKLQRLDSFKDLGVTFQSDLSFKNHITEKINKANNMLGIIKRNFRNINQDTFVMLYKLLVRCHLEYANSVWNSYH